VKIIYEKAPKTIDLVLLFIAAVLILLLMAGTIIGLVRSRYSDPLISFGRPVQTEQVPILTGDIRVFPDLGRLRIPLTNSSTMILSISFPYSADDIAFTEELAVRINDLRILAIDYFSALPQDKLIHIDEEAAKQEILRRFNVNLRLGRIETLYFNDMIIIDNFH